MTQFLKNMRYLTAGVALVGVLGLVGCEWDSGGDGVSGRYNFVNFSGVYRGINGGLLVTDYSSEIPPAGGVNGSTTTNFVAGETVASGNGSSSTFNGELDHDNIVPGSLTISGAGFTFTDVDADEVLTGEDGTSGTITYSTGQWSLNYKDNIPASGASMKAKYNYIVDAASSDESDYTGSGASGTATSGASGKSIYAFTVEHYGADLRIIDNNGKEYKGKLGDVRSTSGVNQDNNGTLVVDAGDTFIGNFEAKGTSAAGKSVTIAGTLQAVVQTTSGQSGILDARQMFGTWIESNGRTGDVQGEASPITITIPNSSSNSSTNS